MTMLTAKPEQMQPGQDFLITLEPGQASCCPACGSARWTCWAEVENEEIVGGELVDDELVGGVVVGCEVEAGLECRDCGHVWIEVQL